MMDVADKFFEEDIAHLDAVAADVERQSKTFSSFKSR